MRRPVGNGSVVVVGDSGFALNHNLGYYDGQMVEGVYDNADFCRWLLTRLFEGIDWVPPDPALRDKGSTDAASGTPEPAARGLSHFRGTEDVASPINVSAAKMGLSPSSPPRPREPSP
ncbi:MAG: hypothetical protein NTW96_22550 [Planctomycetia bacterium]|nr:hypothetical protein [Planctomycetia bacterium]